MSTNNITVIKKIVIRKVELLAAEELDDLCDAALETIADNSSFSLGFSYSDLPDPEKLRRYFLGALLVPEREQFVCEINGVIGGYLELLKPVRSNGTRMFATEICNHFVAPWARSNGIARDLLSFAEKSAKNEGFSVIKLSLRATLEAAINLYERCDYTRWGVFDMYEKIGDNYIKGYYYYKEI